MHFGLTKLINSTIDSEYSNTIKQSIYNFIFDINYFNEKALKYITFISSSFSTKSFYVIYFGTFSY